MRCQTARVSTGLIRRGLAVVAVALSACLAACGAHPRDGYVALGSVEGVQVYGSVTFEPGYYSIEMIKDGDLICDGAAGLETIGALPHWISACDGYGGAAMTFAIAVGKGAPGPAYCSGVTGAPIPTVQLHTPADWPVDVVAAYGHEDWGAVALCSDFAGA